MKWHIVQSNFYSSETVGILEAELGPAGPWALLKIIGYVAKETTNEAEFKYFINHGWRKPHAVWRKISGFSPKKWEKFLIILTEKSQISVKKTSFFLHIKFLKPYEFLSARAYNHGRHKNVGHFEANFGPILGHIDIDRETDNLLDESDLNKKSLKGAAVDDASHLGDTDTNRRKSTRIRARKIIMGVIEG